MFYDWLAERALSFGNVTTGTNTDSIMFGAQLGYRIPFSDSTRLTLAGTYMDFDGVQGYNPFFGGSSFGNTTTSSGRGCSRTLPVARLRQLPAWCPTSTSSKARLISPPRLVAGRCASSSTTRRTPKP